MIIGELTETFPPMQDGVGRVCWAYCSTLEKKGHTAYYIAPEDPDHSRFPDLRTLTYRGIQIPGQNYRFGVPDWSPEFRRQIREIPEIYSLIFGNEGSGLPAEFAAAGQAVRIESNDRVDSLNLGIAAGIGIYQFIMNL